MLPRTPAHNRMLAASERAHISTRYWRNTRRASGVLRKSGATVTPNHTLLRRHKGSQLNIKAIDNGKTNSIHASVVTASKPPAVPTIRARSLRTTGLAHASRQPVAAAAAESLTAFHHPDG